MFIIKSKDGIRHRTSVLESLVNAGIKKILQKKETLHTRLASLELKMFHINRQSGGGWQTGVTREF